MVVVGMLGLQRTFYEDEGVPGGAAKHLGPATLKTTLAMQVALAADEANLKGPKDG